MSSKKEAGTQLLKQGYSYSEIKSKLGIAKSTINNWFSQLSEKEKNKIRTFRIENWQKSVKKYQKKRHQQKLTEERKIQRKAAKKIGSFSKRELFLVGTSLYWAEGSKTSRWHLQFSNSDPKMITLMMKFFRECCHIKEKNFYMQMILHKNIRRKIALEYWSQVTGVSKKQFKKPCFSLSKSSKGIRKKYQLPYGTLQIRIFNKKLTHQTYGYIMGLKYAEVA